MTIRLVSHGKVSDYDEFLPLMRRWEDHVRVTPGAVRVEGYGDPQTSTVHFDEEWADGDALMNHIGQMQESGLLDEIFSIQTIEALFLLTPTEHPGVNAMLDQFQAVRMNGFASVTA